MTDRSKPSMLFREGTDGESSQSVPPKVGPEQPCRNPSRPDGSSRYRAVSAAHCAEFRWYRVILRPDECRGAVFLFVKEDQI